MQRVRVRVRAAADGSDGAGGRICRLGSDVGRSVIVIPAHTCEHGSQSPPRLPPRLIPLLSSCASSAGVGVRDGAAADDRAIGLALFSSRLSARTPASQWWTNEHRKGMNEMQWSRTNM